MAEEHTAKAGVPGDLVSGANVTLTATKDVVIAALVLRSGGSAKFTADELARARDLIMTTRADDYSIQIRVRHDT